MHELSIVSERLFSAFSALKVAARNDDLVSDLFHLPPKRRDARFGAHVCALFAVVEHVFLSHLERREIRHHHVAAREDSLLPALRLSRAECCRRWADGHGLAVCAECGGQLRVHV